MVFDSEADIFATNIISHENGDLKIDDAQLFRDSLIDNLVDTIILSDNNELKATCFWIAYQSAIQSGVIPSSIQPLYLAHGQNNIAQFTVPAINLRTLTYDLARAVFRAAQKNNTAAFVLEIAKSEIIYTDQSPQEYAAMVLLAALREGFRGPVFIQGDHFKFNCDSFNQNYDREIGRVQELILSAIKAGFYNLDIDPSTLVDESLPTLSEQQKLNCKLTAAFTKFIRQNQPEGIEIAIGGEIGEVGGKNSTIQELDAFMQGYQPLIEGIQGICKLSVQTGTVHGGVVLPDGSIAQVKLDFDTLQKLSNHARQDYHLAGCVQHGASTLPHEAFHHFPPTGCIEIHLATQFQNMVFDYLPLPLKEKIYHWLNENISSRRTEQMTNDQFIYKMRKQALGPFKKEIHSLPREWRNKISQVIEEEFSFLFQQLNVCNTIDLINTYIKPTIINKTKDDFLIDDQKFRI